MTSNTVDAFRRHRRRSLPHMSQSPIERPHIELDLEDFRRLGVRPYEYRLTVIRQAVARSSGPLAKKQLSSPSAQSRKQLSRVAISAYRVLDPRQRRDLHQRVHVGRIQPNALSWAGRTNFHSQGAQQQTEAHATDTPFARDELSDLQLIEMLDHDTPGLDRVEAAEQWSKTLRDQDLLATTPLTRRMARLWDRRKNPFVLLALAGALIGTLLGVSTLLPTEDRVRLARADSFESNELHNSVPVVNHETVSGSTEPAACESGTIATSLAGEVPKTPELRSDIEPELDPVFPLETEPKAMAPLDSELDTEFMNSTAELMSTEEMSTEEASPESPISMEDSFEEFTPDVDPIEMSPESTSPYLPDPFLGYDETLPQDPPVVPPVEEDVVRSQIDATKKIAQEMEIGRLAPDPAVQPSTSIKQFPVPEDESVRASQSRLKELVPELLLITSLDNVNVAEQIARIEAIEKELEVGSVDQWAARLLIAEYAWTIEGLDAVAKRLEPLGVFENSASLPMSQSFVAACSLARLPKTHQHLLTVGMELADNLLLDESYQACEDVIESLEPLAQFLESDSSKKYLQQFAQAAQSMNRSSDTVKRMLNEDGEIDSDASNVGSAGRYYCLMLRQWDRGLPWLVSASDTRIARLASQELELSDQADADEVFEIAQRWDKLAERSSGRAAESMFLHTIGLMRDAESMASGLQKLEIQRSIDERLVSLPPYLKTVADEEAVLRRISHEPDAVSPVPEKLVDERAEGLSGRITINGQDLGVQLNYELGVTIRKKAFKQVAEQIGRSLDGAMMELVGEIEVGEEPIRMMVSTAEIPEGSIHQIEIDGNVLEFEPLEKSTSITLRTGVHTVTWKLRLDSATPAYLRLHNAANGKRISVFYRKPTDPQETNVNVEMVRRAS